MRPIAWATGSMLFSVRGYMVPSELSEPSGRPGCFRWKLGLLLMSDMDSGSDKVQKAAPTSAGSGYQASLLRSTYPGHLVYHVI